MVFFINISSFSAPPSSPLTLSFTTTTPGTTRGQPRPLHPATHLQLRWVFPNGTDLFTDEIAPEIIRTTRGEHDEGASGGPPDITYHIELPRKQMPRVQVTADEEGAADVTLYVWKGDKVLGEWPVGKVEGLGVSKS